MDKYDAQTFPENFPDVSEKTFIWTFENRPDFVDFTVKEMKKCTGLFKTWKLYCQRKIKNTD